MNDNTMIIKFLLDQKEENKDLIQYLTNKNSQIDHIRELVEINRP